MDGECIQYGRCGVRCVARPGVTAIPALQRAEEALRLGSHETVRASGSNGRPRLGPLLPLLARLIARWRTRLLVLLSASCESRAPSTTYPLPLVSLATDGWRPVHRS